MKKTEEIVALFPSMYREAEALKESRAAYDAMWVNAFKEWDRVVDKAYGKAGQL